VKYRIGYDEVVFTEAPNRVETESDQPEID